MSEISNRQCGVLWDLDGVLLDSEGKYSIFWARMDEEHPTGIDNFASYIKGFHLNRIMGYFESEEVRQQILDELLTFERDMVYEFFPGAIELVKQLRVQSLYSQHPEFPTLFDHIITGDMVTKAKPDPDCYLMGAKLLGIDINDCIVVEDSRNGLIAGRESGARVIGIATTLSREAVNELSDMTLDSIGQLSVEQMLNTRPIVK